MPLKAPNLDDRTYGQLREMALEHIQHQLNADWSNLTPGDPGVMLLEAFAYLTDQLIYRLNRVPHEKVYVALLQLLGISRHPPAAAQVMLTFTNMRPQEVVIPAGTQVTTDGGADDAPIFRTLEEIVIPAAKPTSPGLEAGTERATLEEEASPSQTETVVPVGSSGTVKARNCQIDQQIFQSTGEYGQTWTVRHLPIIAPTNDNFDLLVEVESDGHYSKWEEVSSFNHLEPESQAYVVDRASGLIRFAPAVTMTVDKRLDTRARPLAAIPPKGANIRISYAYCDEARSGIKGNVTADKLTLLLVPIPDVTVTNLHAAVGGQAAETLANALQRGPQEIYSRERTITARDFERFVERPGSGIARAKASTQIKRWAHGERGTVEIRLVPTLTNPETTLVALTQERREQGEDALEIQALRRALADSQPMGTAVSLHWAHYKKVWVEAQITLKERAALSEVRTRLLPAIDHLLSPLASTDGTGSQGWPFGQTLYASDIYGALLKDEGVDA